MAVVETHYEHGVLDRDGTPRSADTARMVITLVTAQRANSGSLEELQVQPPPHTWGQIYPALAYHWVHQEESATEITRRLAWAAQMRETTPPIPLAQRLRAQTV